MAIRLQIQSISLVTPRRCASAKTSSTPSIGITEAGDARERLPADGAVVAQQHDRLEHRLDDAALAEDRVEHLAGVAAAADEARQRPVAGDHDAVAAVLLRLRQRLIGGQPERMHAAGAGRRPRR